MTLALGVVGAVVGAVLGVLSLAGILVAVGAWRQPGAWGAPVAAAATFGAVLGFVLAPVAAWTLMRHVPLWRAIAETALGTVIGVIAGWMLTPTLGRGVPVPGLGIAGIPWPVALGLAGFAAAALRLRLTHRTARRAPSGVESPPA